MSMEQLLVGEVMSISKEIIIVYDRWMCLSASHNHFYYIFLSHNHFYYYYIFLCKWEEMYLGFFPVWAINI